MDCRRYPRKTCYRGPIEAAYALAGMMSGKRFYIKPKSSLHIFLCYWCKSWHIGNHPLQQAPDWEMKGQTALFGIGKGAEFVYPRWVKRRGNE